MKHTNNFDGLRLIAAFMVLWSHMFALSGRVEPTLLGGHGYGNAGVMVFFAISGYLVTASWDRDPDLGRFLARRFLRIAPALFVCLPLVYVSVKALGLSGFPDNPYHNLNGSLWTIPLEVYCYFMLAGASLILKRRSLVFALVMLAGWWENSDAPRSTVFHFGMVFALGMILWEYPRLRSLRWSALLIAIGFALIPTFVYQLALTFIIAPLAVYIGTQSWPVMRDVGRLGDVSYGVYIYAWPVQQIAVSLLGRENFPLLLGVTLAVTTTLAAASWRWIEQPALGRKPNQASGNAAVGGVNVVPEG